MIPGLVGAAHREHLLLDTRLFKLKAGDTLGTRGCLALGQVLESLAHAFVIALPVILAAEIFVEESPQRPQVFTAILTTHYVSPFLTAVFIISENFPN